MTPNDPPPITEVRLAVFSLMTVSSGLTSRDTSFQGRETGTASATEGKRAKRAGSSAPWLPVMPMAVRMAPGILWAVRPMSRIAPQTSSMSASVAPAFIRTSMGGDYGTGHEAGAAHEDVAVDGVTGGEERLLEGDAPGEDDGVGD